MAVSPLSVAKFLRAFIAWWLIWAILQGALLYWLGLNWKIAVADSLVTNTLTGGACLLVCYVMQFYVPRKDRYWYILTISIFLTATVIILTRWILSWLWPEADYLLQLKQSLPIRSGFAFLLIVCMSVISMLWYSFYEQQEAEQRRTDAQALSKETELIALRQQLQPHFLFNSLNSISALVGSRPEEARHMIHQLSDFLRGTIKKDDSQFISMQEELQQLQLYLDIEKVRFGHRLITSITTTEEANQLKLPSLLLQPVVENSIKFGLYDTTGAVEISIKATVESNQLIVKVQNPFDPETTRPKSGTGFGLSSVQRRLYLLFARNDLVSTAAENNLFITTLKIPQLI